MPSPSSSTPDPEASRNAFEVGKTSLDLDNVSEADLDALSLDDEASEKSVLNLQTVSGLILILTGLVYLLMELGVGAPYSPGLAIVFPWLVGTIVIVTGVGVLAWRYVPSVSSSSHLLQNPMRAESDSPNDDGRPVSSPRLARSRTDNRLLGVCGGIAHYLDLDPTLVRIAFVIGTIFFGPLLIAYFGLAFAMPKAPPSPSRGHPPHAHGAPGSDSS